MATADQIAALRRATGVDPNDSIYTDSLLGGMIDDLGFETSASTVWREKAASAAGLVDTTESGSSRALSQLRKGYLEMATALNPDAETITGSGTYTVGAERV
jgi:hypothetical protein